jgi:hypothetical protein
MMLHRIHLWLGVVTLVVFLLTGQFMDKYLAHLTGMADGPRMVYRSSHIYLLWSGLLNLSFGLHPIESGGGWRYSVKRFASVLVLAAPPLLLVSFFLEPLLSDLQRPYSRAANYLALLGVIMHLVSTRWTTPREAALTKQASEKFLPQPK